ncbi:MAG: hypothetical protein BGO49_13250 [Planctomycetales bacterium 71-10]|nr:MAG: hypothetical protein BGO49_13250 [Planctomycetales bacterium 71-10]
MKIDRAWTVLTLAIWVAGCGGGSTPAGDDAARAAGAFLGELRAGKVEPAWDATSREFKSLMGLDALRDLVKKNPALRGEAEFAEALPSAGGLTECVFRGSNAKPRGKPAPVSVRVTLSPGAGGWAVERLAVE